MTRSKAKGVLAIEVGHQVKITKSIHNWVDKMDKFVGRIVTVTEVVGSIGKEQIRFSGDDGWSWCRHDGHFTPTGELLNIYIATREQIGTLRDRVCTKWKHKIDTFMKSVDLYIDQITVPESLIEAGLKEANAVQTDMITKLFKYKPSEVALTSLLVGQALVVTKGTKTVAKGTTVINLGAEVFVTTTGKRVATGLSLIKGKKVIRGTEITFSFTVK